MPRKAYEILKKYAMRSLGKDEPGQKKKKNALSFDSNAQLEDKRSPTNKKRIKMDGKESYKVDVL